MLLHPLVSYNQLNSDTIYLEIGSECIGKELSPTRPPSTCKPTTNCKPRLLTCASDWPNRYRLEVPTTLSLGVINLLEWLTELRKPIYSLDCWFVTKDIRGCESTASWRDTQGKVLNKGALSSWSLGLPRWRVEVFWFLSLAALQTPSFQVLTEDALHRHDWLNPWPLAIDSTSSPPHFPRG